ncbi:MAG: hypothetical protein DRN01_03015 [Thermoplasmata archaeon]|nr:MAG: hypothetical protein DRN01_03015 [Thermoplasmata archaeon]
MFPDVLGFIVLVLSGFFGGVFVGIASGTAAIFVIPCLTLLMGFSMHHAVGTNPLVDSVIGGVAGLVFLLNKNVDLRSTHFLVFMGVIGAFFGSRFTSSAPELGLTVFMASFLVVMGVDFVVKGIKKNVDYIESKVDFSFIRKHRLFFMMFFGLTTGLVSGFSGMGGAGMLVFIFVLLFRYDLHTAIGTSLLLSFFIGAAGTLGHVLSNETVFDVALVAAAAAAFGAVFGAVFANRVDEDKLGRLIGFVVLLSGFLLFVRAFV